MAADVTNVASVLARSAEPQDLPVLFAYLKACAGLGYQREEGMALQALQTLGGKEVEDFLIQLVQTHMLGDQRVPGFRDQICLVLGRLGCKRAGDIILEHVQAYGRETSIGEEAIAALGHLRWIEAVPTLLAIALGHSNSKGAEAARALRLIGAESAYAVLAEALDSTDGKIREQALDTLFIIGTPEAKRFLTRSFLDKLTGKRKWIDEMLARPNGISTSRFLGPEDYPLVRG